MKEKERGKNETEKKGSEKKKFQCGNRTHDLLICKHCVHVAIVSPRMRINDQTSRFYIANLDFDDLTVAAHAALAPPIIMRHYIPGIFCQGNVSIA